MTEATSFSGEQDFRIGKVFDRTFSILKHNAILFSLVTGAMWIPAEILSYWSEYQISQNIDSYATVGIFAFVVFVYPISIAILVYATFQAMLGKPVSLATSTKHGLNHLLQVIVISILTAIGVLGGMTLLVVPGLMLMTMWYVAVPICIVEKCGAIDSLNRSSSLTKGYRWQVFAIAIIVLTIEIIIDGFVDTGMLEVGGDIAKHIALVIWNGVFQAFATVLTVVMYRDLRVAKEGLDTNRIASVFD
ncbi:MAG: hypothetical protein P8Y67_06735 [Alphaproteobacteria bacterium]